MPYRPVPAGWIRWARASWSSSREPAGRGPGQRGGGIRVKIRAGVQPEQPERARGLGIQVPVGPGEHGPHRRPRVTASVQQVQPLLIGQLRRNVGQRGAREAAASSAATRSASGSRAQCPASVAAAAGSASTRSPMSARSRPTASATAAGPGPAEARRPWRPARPAHRGWSPASCRPGCRAAAAGPAPRLAALSIMTSIRRPASRLRYRAARSSGLGRDILLGHAEARRNPASASAAVMGWSGS